MPPTACLFAGATLGVPVVTPGVAVHTSGSQGSRCRFRPASLPVQQWKDPASIPLPDLGKVAKMLGISEGCSRGVRGAKRATASVNLGASAKMALSRTKKALSSSTRTARRPEATEGTFRSQIMLNKDKGLPGVSQKQCHTQPQPVQELVSTVFLVTERPSKPP